MTMDQLAGMLGTMVGVSLSPEMWFAVWFVVHFSRSFFQYYIYAFVFAALALVTFRVVVGFTSGTPEVVLALLVWTLLGGGIRVMISRWKNSPTR